MNPLQTQQRNITVDRLRAIACITVILQHCLSQLVNVQNVAFPPIICLYSFSSKVNVPLFFILSGFLLKQQPIKQFFRKKAPKILIPFIFFTSLKLVYNLQVGSTVHGDTPMEQLFQAFCVGSLYWFSYSIMSMYLLSPLFWRLKTVKFKDKEHDIPVTAIVLFTVIVIFNTLNKEYQFLAIPDYFMFDHTLRYLPFYLLGFILKNFYPLFSRKTIAAEIILAVFSIPLSYFFYIGKLNVFEYFWSTFISMLLCLDIFLLVKPLKRISKIMNAVSKYTYQIFFLDSFVKVIIFFLFGKIFGTNLYQNFVMCVFVIIFEVSVNTGVSCLIAAIAKKIPVVKFLFGLSN